MNFWERITGSDLSREYTARVKALPRDYQIVYKEIQRYFFKVGPVGLEDGTLLSDVVDFFAQGAAANQGVLDFIGTDVASFCDDLIKDTPTYADIYQASLGGEVDSGGK